MKDKPDQPTDTPVEEGAGVVEEAVSDVEATDVPVEDEKEPAEEQRPVEDAPTLDNMPRTPGELRDAAKAKLKRVKEIGPEPVKQAAGGLVDRFFTAVDNFLDKWEKAK